MDDRRFADAVGFALANLQKPSLKLSVYQKEALKNILTEKDTFVCLPTGHGKLIIFECLPLCHDYLSEPGRTSSGISGLAEGSWRAMFTLCTYSKSIMAVSKRIVLKFGVEVSTLFVIATPSWLLSNHS